jgi:siroheme synthase (precorrin-2 oxidase/ferrochelatase)
MALHVIVGAGSVESATARLLAERGDEVRIVSRSGTGPEDTQITQYRRRRLEPKRTSADRRRSVSDL